MTLSSYRMHRIYLAATMGYGLGSDDPEEVAYYKKLRKEMEDMKKDPVKKGNSNYDLNEVKKLLIQLDLNCSEMIETLGHLHLHLGLQTCVVVQMVRA